MKGFDISWSRPRCQWSHCLVYVFLHSRIHHLETKFHSILIFLLLSSGYLLVTATNHRAEGKRQEVIFPNYGNQGPKLAGSSWELQERAIQQKLGPWSIPVWTIATEETLPTTRNPNKSRVWDIITSPLLLLSNIWLVPPIGQTWPGAMLWRSPGNIVYSDLKPHSAKEGQRMNLKAKLIFLQFPRFTISFSYSLHLNFIPFSYYLKYNLLCQAFSDHPRLLNSSILAHDTIYLVFNIQ